MDRRVTLLSAAIAIVGLGSAPAATGAVDARLQGQFAMKGKITRADNVKGEHKGQTVKRKWRFKATCAPGAFCNSVFLRRERAKHRVDKLTLTRTGVGTYSGHGRFYFSLRCAGRVYKHGGEAKFKITVVITKATTIQTEPFATNVTARYSNAHRINHTECGGDLGRDGASYTGKVKSLPGPPAADFDASPGANHTVAFTDRSTRGAGNSPIAKRRWDFGDGSTSSERNPSHRYAAPGAYTVTLTVTDQNGLTDMVSKPITVAR